MNEKYLNIKVSRLDADLINCLDIKVSCLDENLINYLHIKVDVWTTT